VPCGIQDRGVTSLTKELGREITLGEVEERAAGHLAERLNAALSFAAGAPKL
jgi:lipoyl(octanoyl) transferase